MQETKVAACQKIFVYLFASFVVLITITLMLSNLNDSWMWPKYVIISLMITFVGSMVFLFCLDAVMVFLLCLDVVVRTLGYKWLRRFLGYLSQI